MVRAMPRPPPPTLAEPALRPQGTPLLRGDLEARLNPSLPPHPLARPSLLQGTPVLRGGLEARLTPAAFSPFCPGFASKALVDLLLGESWSDTTGV